MAIQTVTVVNVEKVKTGKADRLVLHYSSEKTKGEAWKIGALAVNLDDASRESLLSAKPGEQLNVNIEKDGQYWKLTSVAAAAPIAAKPASSKAPYRAAPVEGRLSDVEKGEGAQRGNVLSNAVALVVAAGEVDLKTAANVVEKMAIDLLAVSQRLATPGNNTPDEVGSYDDVQVDEIDF